MERLTVSGLKDQMDANFADIKEMLTANMAKVPDVDKARPVSARAKAIRAKAKSAKPASRKLKPASRKAKPASRKAKPVAKTAAEKLDREGVAKDHFFAQDGFAVAYTGEGDFAGNVAIAWDGQGRPVAHKAENMLKYLDALEALGGIDEVREVIKFAISDYPENHQ
jgi:hypothetical protein